MCECPVQGKGPKGLKTETASSPGFGSRTPVSVTGLPGAPSQSQVSPEGLKEEAHLCTSRTVLSWDFPGGPVIKICTPSAGDMGSVPGWGTEILHAMGQISLCTTTGKSMHRNERFYVMQPRSHVPQVRPITAKQRNKLIN